MLSLSTFLGVSGTIDILLFKVLASLFSLSTFLGVSRTIDILLFKELASFSLMLNLTTGLLIPEDHLLGFKLLVDPYRIGLLLFASPS
jgi:hypothetical protein